MKTSGAAMPCIGLLPIVMAAAIIPILAFACAPFIVDAETWGDALVRHTVRLALLYYTIAACLMLTMRRGEWLPLSWRGRLARGFWSLAYLAFLVHLAMAMHYAHHWSHADAFEHTRAVSGVGEGIYMSHLFTLLWGLDVATWNVSPSIYARRSVWIGRVLHAFMLFIIFNGMVVYEEGPIRWAGIGLMALLAGMWIATRGSKLAGAD
jgi:hypothetical protein